VENVVAIGNSGGFVEPLEATALMIVCSHVQTLVDFLRHSRLSPTPTLRSLFNDVTSASWIDIRDFLSLHYKLNTALDTPFWQHCRAETDVSNLSAFLEFYQENGPTGFGRHRLPRTENDFGLEGYLVMMVGNRVPYRAQHTPSAAEKQTWERHRAEANAIAQQGLTVEETLAYIRHPAWRWHGDTSANVRPS
jgi:tryptophan halogenase